jgi:hypothetical protein
METVYKNNPTMGDVQMVQAELREITSDLEKLHAQRDRFMVGDTHGVHVCKWCRCIWEKPSHN